MNVIIPEDMTPVSRVAYLIGMQEFKNRCMLVADSIMGDDAGFGFSKSNDLAGEFFSSFYDLADQKIRGAMEDIAIYTGYPTALNFHEAARYAMIILARDMTLNSLLEIKEDDLINA